MSSLPSCRYHPDVHEGVRHCARCGLTYCSNCLVDIKGLPHCGVCKNEQLLDLRSGVDRTVMPYAGIGRRFLAMIVDGLVQAIPMYALMIGVVFAVASLAQMGGQTNPTWILLIYIPVFAIPVLYEALMLSFKNGQTLGKIATKIRVVRRDGSPISKGQAWGRAFLRLIFGCLVILDYVPAFFTDERTALHDLAAGTRVVDTD